MKIINPATEEVITEIQEDSFDAIERKYLDARIAQKHWIEKSLEERKKIVTNFHQLLDTHKEHLATVLSQEVGKPLQQARNELKGAQNRIQWMLQNADKYLSKEVMFADESIVEQISYEPLGVIANISAWNYPYLVGVNVFVPALLAGNAVLYKPSEFAANTGKEIKKLWDEAGLPSGLFQCIQGAREAGEALIHLPLNGYFFTGSYKTGKIIYEKVAPKMVPCQLELGGKDPVYICDDVKDIVSVAAGTADGAFYNNGQSCCSVERIYVHEKVYDAYVKAFVEEVKSYKMGLPSEDGVYIGPLTRAAQLEVLADQVSDALAQGAKVLCGGHRAARKGHYFEPTVLVDVTQGMKLMQEESFGPVIGIMKVKDDQDAIEKMSDTQYGLTAAVYSSNKERAEKILKHMDSGTVYWNCCDRVSAAVPWSGRRHSGFGATLSHVGLRAFAQVKGEQLRK